MDKRKLVYAGHTAITNFDGLTEEVAELRDGASLTIAYVVNPNADLELIRRWNSYPALVDALEAYKAIVGNTGYSVGRDTAMELYERAEQALEAAKQ